MEARIVRIGNSRGIRIPQALLELIRAGEGSRVELEANREGILIRPLPEGERKLDWADAYREMAEEAAEGAEWEEWDSLAGNGTIDDGDGL